MVRVFEAPPQTRDAILAKYGEVFVELSMGRTDGDLAVVWGEIEEAARIPDLNQRNQALEEALTETSWTLDNNIRTIVDINQQMIEGQISEGMAEWLCYQAVPLNRMDDRIDDDDQTLIWPEDKDRAVETFEWYMAARKDSRVQNMMREMFPGRSIKNPLEFSIYDLEDLQDTLTPVKQQTAKNQRWKPEERGIAPGKARTILDDDGWLIVEITDAAVASSYASGTRWCTSNRRTAQGYLNDGPLYVLFRNGQKYGQIHGQSNQIMDVRDRPIQNRIRSWLDSWPRKGRSRWSRPWLPATRNRPNLEGSSPWPSSNDAGNSWIPSPMNRNVSRTSRSARGASRSPRTIPWPVP